LGVGDRTHLGLWWLDDKGSRIRIRELGEGFIWHMILDIADERSPELNYYYSFNLFYNTLRALTWGV
jgi:hypothetical protein